MAFFLKENSDMILWRKTAYVFCKGIRILFIYKVPDKVVFFK